MEDREPWQYKTPFQCPECKQCTFQTDAVMRSEADLVGAECTNCGHALTEAEIGEQMGGISNEAIALVVGQYRA